MSEPTGGAIDGVLIVGGGYAGVHAAAAVRKAGRRATIVDPTGRHDFVTRLAAVAGGTAPAADAATPLDEFGASVIVGTMTSADDGSITLDDGRTMTADAVVITAGAIPVSPPIDGLEHAFRLRTESDAHALRAAIADADSLVVIGGGATGVQLAGSAAHRFPNLAVTLVDGSDRLLTAMGGPTSRDAERILRQRGVDLILGEDVESIEVGGVIVGDRRIAGVAVWAAGFTARADTFGIPCDDQGRVLVDDDLRVTGWTSTFAAGDIAAHSDRRGGELPMSAQIAVQAGAGAGANAARLLDGEPLRRVDLGHRGWVLDLGGYRGLAELGPIALTAPLFDLVPPLLHWGIDVKHLAETRGVAGLTGRSA
ncbi:MAG: NAD(P)/FAD-dependent oxidoreductase [Ilumatobacter sp.]